MKKLVFIISVLLSVSACANKSVEMSEGGVVEPNRNIPVVIKVLLSSKGEPVVDLETAVVDENQTVIWAGPKSMVIKFSKGSPFEGDKFQSRGGVVSTSASKKIDWNEGEKFRAFKYDIVVDGYTLDPIIIRRRSF